MQQAVDYLLPNYFFIGALCKRASQTVILQRASLRFASMRSSLSQPCGARPKIRFVYNIIRSDDERHDARRPIVCRIGHEGESARFTAGAVFPLPLCGQDSEVVSVERAQEFFAVRGTTNLRRLAIDERACIVSDSIRFHHIASRLLAQLYQRVASVNRGVFIFSQPAESNLLRTSFGIEIPHRCSRH